MSYLGTNKIGKMFLGNTEIAKAYLGTDLVFQNTPPTPPSPPVMVDYIETDGVAYINTGIKGNVPFSSKVQMVPVAPASGNSYILGCRKDSGNTRFSPVIVSSGKKLGFGYYSGMFPNLDISASINNGTVLIAQTRIRQGSQIIYKKEEGESSYTNYSATVNYAVNTNIDLYLFGMNDQGSPIVAAAGTKIKAALIYSDYDWTTLVFEGYACYYNGQYGLWDNISDSFFGNAANSGSFSGPSI